MSILSFHVHGSLRQFSWSHFADQKPGVLRNEGGTRYPPTHTKNSQEIPNLKSQRWQGGDLEQEARYQFSKGFLACTEGPVTRNSLLGSRASLSALGRAASFLQAASVHQSSCRKRGVGCSPGAVKAPSPPVQPGPFLQLCRKKKTS